MGEDAEDDRSAPRRVWIFHGEAGSFASGVFDDKVTALAWVSRHGLTGVVAEHVVGDGCYDLAVREGRFCNTNPHHGTPEHIARFSPGLDHIHVQAGQPEM